MRSLGYFFVSCIMMPVTSTGLPVRRSTTRCPACVSRELDCLVAQHTSNSCEQVIHGGLARCTLHMKALGCANQTPPSLKPPI